MGTAFADSRNKNSQKYALRRKEKIKMRSIYIFIGENKDNDGKYRRLITEKAVKYGVEITDKPEKADVMVVLGGDGTILRATPTALKYGIPVIGLNLGRIGYMAELDATEDALIEDFFKGRYSEEKRITLSVEFGGEKYTALNDAVLHSRSTHMIKLRLCCNGKPVNTYRGDGLIFATPTGSTAYSMSAGGPVIDPTLECIEITPICTQSLMARPLIFAPESMLSVSVDSDNCIMTVDGGSSIEISAGSEIKITKGERVLRMIKLKEDGFYGVLRRKFSV